MIFVKLLLTAVFWGGTFIAGRLLAGSADPYSAAFLRFFIASCFLLVLTVKMEGSLPKINFKTGVSLFLLGLTGVFTYNICFFSGLQFIQANQASLIIACNPVFISFSSALLFKERLSGIKLMGIILSVTGALIVISKGNPIRILDIGLGKGELLIFGCVISWVAYSLLGKKTMMQLSPLASVCYSSVIGAIMLAVPAFSKGLTTTITAYSLVEWGSLFYLGFFGTVLGFLWYYQGINQIGPTRAGIFINFVPVSAIFLAFFILDESITASLILGSLFVIAGVYLTNKPQSQIKEAL